jgi:hypothetical protein
MKVVEAKKVIEMANKHDTVMAKMFKEHFAKLAKVEDK